MVDHTDPLGRLAEHARNPYPEQPTSWRHLVEHWKRQTEVSVATGLLTERLATYRADLAQVDADLLAHHTGDRTHTFAQLNARQAKLTGHIEAIEAELARRRVERLEAV